MYVFIQSSPNLKVFLSQVENELFSIADVLKSIKDTQIFLKKNRS